MMTVSLTRTRASCRLSCWSKRRLRWWTSSSRKVACRIGLRMALSNWGIKSNSASSHNQISTLLIKVWPICQTKINNSYSNKTITKLEISTSKFSDQASSRPTPTNAKSQSIKRHMIHKFVNQAMQRNTLSQIWHLPLGWRSVYRRKKDKKISRPLWTTTTVTLQWWLIMTCMCMTKKIRCRKKRSWSRLAYQTSSQCSRQFSRSLSTRYHLPFSITRPKSWSLSRNSSTSTSKLTSKTRESSKVKWLEIWAL